ncbi:MULTISPECIES: hypothetical protein [unclassified Bradyrhizobium]
MLIVETGHRTRFGMIAAELATNAPPTALDGSVMNCIRNGCCTPSPACGRGLG